jgi:hypothetical protein
MECTAKQGPAAAATRVLQVPCLLLVSPQSLYDLYCDLRLSPVAFCMQRDASIFSLLQDACWPVKQEAVYAALMEMGADAVDALAAAAHSGGVSSMFLGVTYHAHVALHYVVGELSAVKLRQLLQERLPVTNAADIGSSSSSAAAAAAQPAHEAAGGAHPSLTAGGTAERGRASSSSIGEGRQANAAAAAARKSDVGASLEGALMLVRGRRA